MEQKIEVKFLEKDKFQVKGYSSETLIYTDKKVEGLPAAGPNPLELFLSALGSCVGVFAKRYLTNHNIEFKKLNIEVNADFVAQNPMRLDNITAKINTDADLADKKDAFLRFIKACPIHNTILNAKEVKIEFF